MQKTPSNLNFFSSQKRLIDQTARRHHTCLPLRSFISPTNVAFWVIFNSIDLINFLFSRKWREHHHQQRQRQHKKRFANHCKFIFRKKSPNNQDDVGFVFEKLFKKCDESVKTRNRATKGQGHTLPTIYSNWCNTNHTNHTFIDPISRLYYHCSQMPPQICYCLISCYDLRQTFLTLIQFTSTPMLCISTKAANI